MNINAKVKSMREDKDLSQEELSRLLDVSQALVAQWETGKLPISKKQRIKIAELFGISLDELEGKINLDHFSPEVAEWLQEKGNIKMIEQLTRLYRESH